ncbi:MAG TPA: tRNA (cytidine(34)-2'-O)-methyltransferase [Candidimonas sp.]|nr:tRNA (cytidine(34)-2'-O)-methyltransferase [Candidimonas sp.]
MFHIVLVSPEIPPNTGNVIRLAANTGSNLHLVRPLGFELDDTRLKRAGLDYHEWANMQVHDSLALAFESIGGDPQRRFALTTKGTRLIGQTPFSPGDVFVFGRETAGMTPEQMDFFPSEQRLRLPMMPQQRSLNLSNAVAVTVYEAWRQAGYAGSV